LTDADSASLITAMGADGGVSNGATFITDQRGISWKAFVSAGSTSSTDSTDVGTTTITNASSLTDGKYYCVRVVTYDALGNGTLYPDAQVISGAQASTTCPATLNQQRKVLVDFTTPTLAWNATNYSQGDTSVASVPIDADYKYTLTEKTAGTTSVRVCSYTTSGNAVVTAIYNSLGTTTTTTCDTYVTQKSFGGISGMISTDAYKFAQAAISTNGVYRIEVKHQDAAGNLSDVMTKYVLVDNTAPSVTAPASVNTTLGSSTAEAAYISDNVDVRQAALTVASVGYSSNDGSLLGAVITSSGARVAAVLEDASSVLNTNLGVPTASRFFNVPVSISSSMQYLIPLSAAGDTAKLLGTLHSGTSGNSGNDGIGIINGYRTKFAFRAYDQVGNTTLSSYSVNTIVDSTSTFGTASRLALVGNGLISATDATTADAGTTGATSSVIKVAISPAVAALNAGYSNTKTLTLSLSMYRYQDKTGHMVRSLAFKQANNYCASNAAAATTQIVNDAGTESQMAAGSQISSTRTPAANVKPTIYVYAPLVGAASWGLVGSMTLSNSVGIANSAGFCDDVDTYTYTYAWTLASRAPATQWSNGQLLFVIVGDQGQATIARGPYVDLVK